ncbi:MAG: hypothetical protein V2B20_10510 [Pseudomonadota bacterium]
MRFERVLATLLTPIMILLNCPVMAAQANDAKAVKPTTEIFHKPTGRVEAGKRITLYTEVNDPSGIDVVRVYFKSKEAADFTFIVMQPTIKQEKSTFQTFKNMGSNFDGQAYSGILPAPAKGSKAFEYLVLVKTKSNVVVKSQTYKVSVSDGKGESVAEKEPIKVYSELSEAPANVAGFSDNIALDIVESGAKLGVVAGLYAGVTNGGGGAISGGTVAASTGGITTTAVVVTSAVAVAVVGGVAVAAGGGGGSDSGGGSGGRASYVYCAENYPSDACAMASKDYNLGCVAYSVGSCSSFHPDKTDDFSSYNSDGALVSCLCKVQ